FSDSAQNIRYSVEDIYSIFPLSARHHTSANTSGGELNSTSGFNSTELQFALDLSRSFPPPSHPPCTQSQPKPYTMVYNHQRHVVSCDLSTREFLCKKCGGFHSNTQPPPPPPKSPSILNNNNIDNSNDKRGEVVIDLSGWLTKRPSSGYCTV